MLSDYTDILLGMQTIVFAGLKLIRQTMSFYDYSKIQQQHDLEEPLSVLVTYNGIAPSVEERNGTSLWVSFPWYILWVSFPHSSASTATICTGEPFNTSGTGSADTSKVEVFCFTHTEHSHPYSLEMLMELLINRRNGLFHISNSYKGQKFCLGTSL